MESPESPPPMDQQTLGCERTYTDSDELISPIIAAEPFHSCLSNSNLMSPEPDLSESDSTRVEDTAGIARSSEDSGDIERDGSSQAGFVQTSESQYEQPVAVDESSNPHEEELQLEPCHIDNEAEMVSEYSLESSCANAPACSNAEADNVGSESSYHNYVLRMNVSSNELSVIEDEEHEGESEEHSRLDDAIPKSVEVMSTIHQTSKIMILKIVFHLICHLKLDQRKLTVTWNRKMTKIEELALLSKQRPQLFASVVIHLTL